MSPTKKDSRRTVRGARQKSGSARITLTLLIGLVLLGGIALAGVGVIAPHGDCVARGVAILGVDLSDRPAVEARTLIADALEKALPEQLTLSAGVAQRTVTPRNLGITPDTDHLLNQALAVGRVGAFPARVVQAYQTRLNGVPLSPAYNFEENAAKAVLADFGHAINHVPVDATAHWDSVAKKVVVTTETPGARLDIHTSLKLVQTEIVDKLNAGDKAPAVLTLPYVDKPARVTAIQLGQVDTVLGAFTTSFSTSTTNRASNVETAAHALDDTIVSPGSVFSFNDEVGPRDTSNGFRIAPVIVNGQLKPGIGGGVCQVSTTLYNAVLLANLGIVERSHHSLPIHYAPAGQDATVSYGAIDFRFRNTTAAPVIIDTIMNGRKLTVQILGKGPAPQVRIERTNITSLPSVVRINKDATLPVGAKILEHRGKPGVKVTVVRIVGDGPTATREELSHDRYLGEPTVYRVGFKGEGSATATTIYDTTGKAPTAP